MSHQTGVQSYQGSRQLEGQVSGQSNTMHSGEKCTDTNVKTALAYEFGAVAVLNHSGIDNQHRNSEHSCPDSSSQKLPTTTSSSHSSPQKPSGSGGGNGGGSGGDGGDSGNGGDGDSGNSND